MVKKVDIIASIGAQDRTGNAFRQVDRNINSLRTGSDRTSKAVSGNFRMMRGSASQFGYQIQDIAVQLQSGQNALLVFGQQGSQIASIFGPGGAFLGAILAVSAALGTALLPKLFGAQKALVDLDAQLSKVRETMKLTADGSGILTGEFEELVKVSEELARNALLQSYNSALLAVEQSQNELKESTDGLGKSFFGLVNSPMAKINNLAEEFDIARHHAAAFNQALDQIQSGDTSRGVENLREIIATLIEPTSGANSEFRVLAGTLLDNIDKYSEAESSANELKSALETLAAGGDLVTESGVEQINTINQQIEAMRREAAQLEMTARAKVIYNAAMDGATPAQLEEIVRIHDKIAAYNEEQEALQALLNWQTQVAHSAEDYKARELAAYKKAQEEKNKMRDEERNAEMALMSSRLALLGQFSGAMEHAYKEGSKAQKAAFIVSKGIAAAEAIINAELAAVKALAELPPPSNVVYSNVIRAMGYASAATIAGTALGSFEGGGFTGNGARVGGMDGKGGFPAIVHPNETIIDHEKGGGAGVNVNFHISAVDADGVKELLMKQRGTIIGMVRQAANERGRRSAA